MAHEISIRADGFAEIAFVGDTPWHKLGQSINPDATIEEWQQQAGMDWTIESAPVFYTTANNGIQTFPHQNVLHRSDTGASLGIVSDRYHAVQPKQVLEFFRELVDVAGFKIQVAGTLKGGRRLWAIANTGRFEEVAKNDGIGSFLLLSTSCDRSLATTARFTSVRVVCNNTLSYAVSEENKTAVSFTHLSKFDPAKMQERLMKGVSSFSGFMQTARWLNTQRMLVTESEAFLAALLKPVSQVEDGDIRENRQYQAILSLFDGGAKGSEMCRHTKWAMLNAVTEFYDHHQPSRSDDARLNSAWFGNGDKIKNNALMLLTA